MAADRPETWPPGACCADLSCWQHATELLIEAAERGGSIEATTEQIERALFLQGMWMPK